MWQVAAAVLASVGGGAVIVLAGASWLGKVWATRILGKERARYSEELAEFSSKANKELARLHRELDVAKQTELRIHSDKLLAYRAAIDVVADLLAVLNKHQLGILPTEEAATGLERFERGRLRLYGYLGMLAPQSVMDAQDQLMEYLLGALHGTETWDWATMRSYALVLLNEIRKDIGIDKSPIEYRGAG